MASVNDRYPKNLDLNGLLSVGVSIYGIFIHFTSTSLSFFHRDTKTSGYINLVQCRGGEGNRREGESGEAADRSPIAI